MSYTQLMVSALTTFDVADNGKPTTLVLPVDCLNQLLMTIPKIVHTAIERSHPDRCGWHMRLKDLNWNMESLATIPASNSF